MDHQFHDNGNNLVSEINSDATAVILKSEQIEIVKHYGEPISRRGVKMRKVTTTKLVPRRTFIKGTLKGKYWGEFDDSQTSLKDIGHFYNITLYESEIFVDREHIKTVENLTFLDFLAGIAQTGNISSYQHLEASQLKNNVLVVNEAGTVNRYEIDLHEPRLYNIKIAHGLHQSADQEVFGTIESNICGYLLDKTEVIEESYVVVEDVPPPPPSPVPPSQPIIDKGLPQKTEDNTKSSNLEDLGRLKYIDRITNWVKSRRNNWSLFPILFVLFLFLLAFVTLGAASLWIFAVAAFLFFVFQKPGFRIPTWIYALLFLFLGLMLWNALKPNFSVIDSFTDSIKKITGRGVVESNHVASRQHTDNKSGKGKATSASDKVSEGPTDSDNGDRKKSPANDLPKDISENEVSNAVKPPDSPVTTTSKSDLSSFDSYLSKGLKAVEDEEYALANQNFKQAFNLNPNNPRLKQLADEFTKQAEEKCQIFRSANSKNLMHIPNNYYQYAASLTQTAPLKCE